MKLFARGTAKAVFHEWQTDSLAAAVATNAAIEGDDATNTSVVPTVRVGNYCTIAQKAFGISGTQEATDSAGRKSELAYQLLKYGKELKRDIESQISQNKASNAGGAGSARISASVESWLSSNWTTAGSGGSPSSSGFGSGIVAAPVDNSLQGTVSEALMKGVISKCWTAGGDPRVIVVGPFNKTKASAFAGIATQYKQNDSGPATIIAAADVYVSDFGEHKIVPSRFNRDRTMLILDTDYWSIDYLRSFSQYPLAKTGDAERRQLICEYTLKSSNQAASGKVADLTTT